MIVFGAYLKYLCFDLEMRNKVRIYCLTFFLLSNNCELPCEFV